MNKDSKYVLFLDDDVRLHPGTIGALTAEMEKKPEVSAIFLIRHVDCNNSLET
jgi:GT2 family glycosyltransferase